MPNGVQLNKKREKEFPSVPITTPHGTNIVVTKSRAETLLSRPPIRFGDGAARCYAAGHGADIDVTEPTQVPDPDETKKAGNR